MLRLARGSRRLARAQGAGTGGGRSKENALSIGGDLLFLRRSFSASASSSSSSSSEGEGKKSRADSSSPSGWHEITIDRTGLVGGGGGRGMSQQRGGGGESHGATASATGSAATPAAAATSASRSQAASLPLPPPIETPMTRHIKALIQVWEISFLFSFKGT